MPWRRRKITENAGKDGAVIIANVIELKDSRKLYEAGADYVAFGAFYPTATKQAKFSAAPEILQWWQETFVLPCVAIGGITPENCEPLVRAGADFIAVASGVWDHPAGPQAAVREFNSVFDRVAADIDQG